MILTPPDTYTAYPYTVLKGELIKRTVGSNKQKLQRLLNKLEFGDRMPTQFLHWMRCGRDGDDTILRELRLPSNIRMVTPSSSGIRLPLSLTN